ncbi:hypothetical protein ACVJGC_005483 [Bradyrhizobium diazoefficiens]
MANPTKSENAVAVAATNAPVPRTAYSVAEFCAMVDISISMYGKLRRMRQAPREMRLGKRVLITTESIAAWKAEREAATPPHQVRRAPSKPGFVKA